MSLSFSTSSAGKVRRRESRVRREAKTIYIDSEVLKIKSARLYQRSRTHSMVRGHKSRGLQQPVYCEPELLRAPSGTYRRRASSTDSSVSSSSSFSTEYSSSTSHHSTSSFSSDTFVENTSKVKIIKVNSNNEPSYVDDGRMFVFDSKKYRIVEMPSRHGPQFQHDRSSSRRRRDREMGWTMDGLSFVAYPGKDSKKLYMLH
nr:conserved hypothetical protein [Hymenolepis microstoma]